jgi:hypothetical protein
MFLSVRSPNAPAIRTTPISQWEWSCGFYPGSEPGEVSCDTAATFEEARADFERAWQVFLSNRTEADFQAWRNQRDWTALKYALWDVPIMQNGKVVDSQGFLLDAEDD